MLYMHVTPCSECMCLLPTCVQFTLSVMSSQRAIVSEMVSHILYVLVLNNDMLYHLEPSLKFEPHCRLSWLPLSPFVIQPSLGLRHYVFWYYAILEFTCYYSPDILAIMLNTMLKCYCKQSTSCDLLRAVKTFNSKLGLASIHSLQLDEGPAATCYH